MKNKKGKKLVVLGAMAALLTLIGVSGSQTYAKYVESTEVHSEQATVAKWGLVIHATDSNLFAKEYEKHSSSETAVVKNAGKSIIKTTGSSSVLAPGATGSVEFSVSGSAEVAAMIYFTTQAGNDDIYIGDYHPLVWTLSCGSTEIISGSLSHVMNGLNTYEKYYYPNGDIADSTFTLSYVWAFESAHDAEDTLLGKIAAADTDDKKNALAAGKAYNLNLSINLWLTVEQVLAETGHPDRP